MTDHVDFERLVAGHISDEGVTPPSDAFYDELFARAARTGPRPEWLALIKESPMRTNSHVAVGSPTVRVVAILAATLLLAVVLAAAGVAGQRLLAAGPIVVAQDGSGTYETIAEAVAVAGDGDEILVRPGTYEESIFVNGVDLVIAGDGNRDDIVVVSGTNLPPVEHESLFWSQDVWPPAWAFILADTDTELSNMTIMGPPAGIGIANVGAATSTTLDGLVVRMPEATGDENPVNWNSGAGGVLRKSVVEGWLGIGPDARIVIEGNELPATCVMLWESGTNLVVRDNVIHGCPYENGINVDPGNEVLIEGNEIWVEDIPGVSSDAAAILVNTGDSTGGSVVIRDNDVHDSLSGIMVEPDESRQVEITGNRVYGNDRGAGSWGIYLRAPAIVTENSVTGNANGMRIVAGVDATLEGNVICDNGTNILAPDEIAQSLADSNEICEDGATE